MSEITLSPHEIDREHLELLIERDNPLKPYAKEILEATRQEASA